ncbi:hypothetical protein WJX77_008121 [Trebouxia sp. C0004]
MFTSLKDHKEEYVDGWRSSKDNQAIEPVIMLLWQKLPCVTKKELQLQLVWASHQIVSLTTGWFTARGQCVSYLQEMSRRIAGLLQYACLRRWLETAIPMLHIGILYLVMLMLA